MKAAWRGWVSAGALLLPTAAWAAEPPTAPRRRVVADLSEAPLLALRSAPSAPQGHLTAKLDGLDAEVTLALTGRPRHLRRAVALSRLAEALGLNLVAPTVLRPVAAGVLADLLRREPASLAWLGSRAIVANDGTVDALVRAKPRGGMRALGRRSTELRRWATWASSPEPLAEEDPALTSSYVALCVLEYLSNSATPASLLYDEPSRTLVLWESASAFSEGPVPESTLSALRAIRRFPKELGAALAALDRARARALFQPGAFETWLLPPRALIGLDERRATVLTLMRATSPPPDP